MKEIRTILESNNSLLLSEEALESLIPTMKYIITNPKIINKKYIPKNIAIGMLNHLVLIGAFISN